MQRRGAQGESVATMDETLGSGSSLPNGAEAAEGDGTTCAVVCSPRLRSRRSASARRRLELAIAYAGEREQFGKQIGVYQAISHSLVDGYVAVELGGRSRTGLRGASPRTTRRPISRWQRRSRRPAEAAVLACEKSIQAHGGIGFTWEHPLHRYYKRALWLEGALGYGREHRAEVAQSLLS